VSDSIASDLPAGAMRQRSISFPSFSLRDLVTALFYYKRVTLLAFVIPCILGLLAGLLAHTSYTAQARLLVLYGSDYVFHPGNRDTGNDITLDRNQIIQAELQIMLSPALAAETLQAVGVDTIYPSLHNDAEGLHLAVARFATDLNVTSVPQSNIIEMSLRNPNREVAVRVLKEMIAHYITYRSGIFDKPGPAGSSSERAQFADRLRKAEEALAQFGSEHGIGNLDEQISLQIHQKADNTNQQSLTAQQVDETAARVLTLHQQLAGLPQTVQMFAESTRSQQSTGLTDSLVKLQTQRRELASKYQDDFPLVRDVDRQIAGVRAQMGQDPSRESNVNRQGRNTIYDDLHREEITLAAQLQGLRAKQTQLVAEAARIQDRTDELSGLSRHYRDLQRTRDVLDQSYRSIARSAEETQLSAAVERAGAANVRVVQPPDAPIAGRNQRPLVMGGGVVLGLLSAIAVFTMLNATRQVFVGVRDVERQLDLPVLLAVPLATSRRRQAPPSPPKMRRRTASRPSFGV
jgi:uncharacterized protein involved in exopolysaccharide biosynthesis